MTARRRYTKKTDRSVVAVQLDLDTDGFDYRKWGAIQTCKRGDWLVNNEGDVYTISGDVFAKTYKRVAPGEFIKTTSVWAEIAAVPGSVTTREGRSHYEAGDYLVFNNEDGTDAYCVAKDKFDDMYESDE